MNRQRLKECYRNTGLFAGVLRGDWVEDYLHRYRDRLTREAAVMVWLLEFVPAMCLLAGAAALETAALPYRLARKDRRADGYRDRDHSE